MPLLSCGSVPPKKPSGIELVNASKIASSLDAAGGTFFPALIGALPSTSRPPHQPGVREPSACEDVSKIVLSLVPSAMILAPRVITSTEPCSPLTTVPGSRVSVTPGSTKSCLSRGMTYVYFAANVTLAMILSLSSRHTALDSVPGQLGSVVPVMPPMSGGGGDIVDVSPHAAAVIASKLVRITVRVMV